MESFKTCRFCDIGDGNYYYSGIDEPFASNDKFIAIASIGALVQGWSLIIPKAHQLSMRNIYADSMFCDLVNSVLSSMFYHYGHLVAFEHGANEEGSITACGTDHAHLHIVPMGKSLLTEHERSGQQWVQCRASEIAISSEENEYLFYCELDESGAWHDPVGYLHVLARPISQFFRHRIAERTGQAGVSDYMRFPHLDIAMHTRHILVSSSALDR